jgi:membrane-associated phospholipid phosphatase
LIRLILVMMAIATVTLIAVTFFIILPTKALFGRQRPESNPYVNRILNMRKLEHGKAMPSGDTLACAFFCVFYYHVFGAHWAIFVMIPLAALGRVYVHCHWLGDTIVGAIIGVVVPHFMFANPYFSILFKPFLLAIFS